MTGGRIAPFTLVGWMGLITALPAGWRHRERVAWRDPDGITTIRVHPDGATPYGGRRP